MRYLKYTLSIALILTIISCESSTSSENIPSVFGEWQSTDTAVLAEVTKDNTLTTYTKQEDCFVKQSYNISQYQGNVWYILSDGNQVGSLNTGHNYLAIHMDAEDTILKLYDTNGDKVQIGELNICK